MRYIYQRRKLILDRNNSKKIKLVNITSVCRKNRFNDLGYYEYNEIENLDIAPRSKVKVKANIIRRKINGRSKTKR